MRVKNKAVLGDFVYDHIEELLLTKKLKCGDRINEQSLEEELGVSRTPVREAVRRLSNEGIVTLYPNRFAEVITFDENSIKELGMVRITMDCLSAQLAIQNGSNRDFDVLKSLAEKCDAACLENNWYEQFKYDSQFHMKLVEISKNDLLINLQKSMVLKTRLLQTEQLDEDSAYCDVSQHGAILDALYSRNLEAVLETTTRHLATFYHLDPKDIKVIHFA
jgi:DNA-binding GntR family transcriptional regulator